MLSSPMLSSPMLRIAVQISEAIKTLQGDWIVQKNAYEKALCNALSWDVFDNRYYDAYNQESYIEIKKGQSGMHFDMVRYAEILLGHGKAKTVTVFFRWNKAQKKITEAYIIDTVRLIQFLHINKEFALMYLRVKARVPRGVNILASATVFRASEADFFANFCSILEGRPTPGHPKTLQEVPGSIFHRCLMTFRVPFGSLGT